MKILLPPSEGKTQPQNSSSSLNLASLLFPELTAQRQLVLEALAGVSAAPDALARLKVGASLADAVAANMEILYAPVGPAHEIYTGVLFQGVNYKELTDTQQQWADDNVLVSSAAFGLLRLGDHIPAYRLSMDVNLGEFKETKIGGLATYWRNQLTPLFAAYAADEVVLDCRSTSYLKSMTPNPELTARVDVYNEVNGQLKKISHHAKHYRGVLAGKLVKHAVQNGTPSGIQELADVTKMLFSDHRVELFPPARSKDPATLALIVKNAG